MPGETGEEIQFGDTLPEGWERSVTAKGVPYYINHHDETSQWEHPEISLAFQRIDGLNEIKFAAYRTAMKLRAIQKLTHLNIVSKYHIERTFFELGLASPANTQVLSVHELQSLLTKLFHLSTRSRQQLVQPDHCVELALNWMLRCLDSGRTALIKVRSVKVVLGALCTAAMDEKYTYLYQQIKTENSVGISQSTLKTLLKDLLLLPLIVSENSTFKMSTVDNAVESCWSTNNAAATDLLSQDEFLHWALLEPVGLVWLPTLHRLSSAETVKHEAKCAKCKVFPIVGFRYRCLKCTNVDFCQSCYWTQQSLKDHKPTHPVREYCLATTTGDDVRDFAKQLKYKITRKYRGRPPKKTYLDYPVTARAAEDRIPDQSPLFVNIHSRSCRLAARLQELANDTTPGGVAEHDGPPAHGEMDGMRRAYENKIATLQGEREALALEVERLTEQLDRTPTESDYSRVPVTAIPDVRSQGVNTLQGVSLVSVPSSLPRTFTTGEWSGSMLGGEEDKLDELLREVLTAFPTHTSETVPCDLDTELLRSVEVIGSAMGTMVEEVAMATH